jgi:Domain of unknown function (DUF4129)
MLPLSVPVNVGRDQAAAAARSELSKNVYAQDRPSLTQQILNWVLDHLARGLDAAASHTPGRWVGLLVIALVLVAVIALVRWRSGPLRRTATAEVPLFVGQLRSAAQYRAAADAAAAQGDWDEAVRQRFRAVVRALEERDVLEPRPGRTADEAAADAARVMTSCSAELQAGARSFDDVAYGARPRDRAADEALRSLDARLAATRPQLAGQPAGSGAFVGPR